MTNVFVFGSNLAGIHGAGAAEYAMKHYGAKRGIGKGFASPTSYAIPTKDDRIRTLSLDLIRKHVGEFLSDACVHKTKTFDVTAIGTGLAGYTVAQIAPMFANAPPNVRLPKQFIDYLVAATADYKRHEISFDQ